MNNSREDANERQQEANKEHLGPGQAKKEFKDAEVQVGDSDFGFDR